MSTATSTSLSDRLRREAYLLRLSWFVQDLRRRDRRSIYADLRASLDDAAAREGMAGAVRGLGPASALGAGYRDAQDRRLPRWMSGVTAFAVVLYAYVLGILSYASGMVSAAEQHGSGEVATAGRWLLTDVEVVSGPGTLGATLSGSPALVVLLALVLFGFARGWRLWTGRRTSAS